MTDTLPDFNGLDPKDLRETWPEEGCVIPEYFMGGGVRALVVKVDIEPGGERRTTFDRPLFTTKGTSFTWSFTVVNWSKDIVARYLGKCVAKMPEPASPSAVKKVIPDWPLACPVCKAPNAAVLLLNQYDCKFGCYGRTATAPKAESWDFTWQGQKWRATKVKVVVAGHRGWTLSDKDEAEFRDHPDLFAIHAWNPKRGWIGSPGWTRKHDEDSSEFVEGYSLVELTEVLP